MLVGDLKLRPLLRTLWKLELLYLSVAVYASTFEYFADDERLGSRLHEIAASTMLELPFSAVAALGSALAIFLAFRNSAAYERWWEARKLWGALVNASRTWARQVLSLIEVEGDTEPAPLHRELVLRHVAYVHALRLHLRKQHERYAAELGGLVGEAELADHIGASNTPANIALWQARALREAAKRGQIDGFRLMRLDATLTTLHDIQGGCERIKNTPLPRQYDRLPRLFTVVFALLLPFGLADTIGLLTPFVSVPLAAVFTLLDGSGRVIEDPFENRGQDTPMSALCVTIERDLRSHLGERELPPALEPIDGVLM